MKSSKLEYLPINKQNFVLVGECFSGQVKIRSWYLNIPGLLLTIA